MTGRAVRGRSVRVWCLVLGLLMQVGCASNSRGRVVDPVSTEALKREISKYACVVRAEAGYEEVLFHGARCVTTDEGTESGTLLSAVVKQAVEDSTPLRLLVRDAYASAYSSIEAGLSPELEKLYWSEDALGPAVLALAQARLVDLGVGCVGCDVYSSRTLRTVSMGSLLTFVEAFIWPKASEKGHVDVFVCVANTGASQLPQDEELLRAGHLAAAYVATDEASARDLQARLGRLRSRGATIDEYRSEIHHFLLLPHVRDAMCQGLSTHRYFTGVEVGECTSLPVRGPVR